MQSPEHPATALAKLAATTEIPLVRLQADGKGNALREAANDIHRFVLRGVVTDHYLVGRQVLGRDARQLLGEPSRAVVGGEGNGDDHLIPTGNGTAKAGCIRVSAFMAAIVGSTRFPSTRVTCGSAR